MPVRPRVALLVESSRAYGRGLLHGIAEYVRVHGPWSIFFEERSPGDGPHAWLRDWKGDGIIARIETRRMARLICDLGLPAVDLAGFLDLGLPQILTSDLVVARLAAEHLLGRGFRFFAYCGFAGVGHSDQRSRAFAQIIAEAGFTSSEYQPSRRLRGTDAEKEQQALLDGADLGLWLQKLPKPAGLMACDDLRGQQVLGACRDVGIKVPDEVAVIGVDNDDVLCDLSDPPLSSVVPNTRQIGFEAAALLDQLMAGQPPPKAPVFIPPLGLVERRSTNFLAIDDPDIASAGRFIRDHACEGITVRDILARVPLSQSALEHRFVALLGRTPKAEIIRVRLERVKQLLAETDFPQKRIAAMTGFVHPEYMNAIFKEKTGVTPRQYRLMVRKGK